MKKLTLKILLSSIAFVVLAAGCSKIYDDYEATCPHEQPVSIIATINKGNLRALTPTRGTTGTVQDHELDVDSWKKEAVDAYPYEEDVEHVFLFVYKKDEPNKPYKVIFYYKGKGQNPLTEGDAVEKGEMNVDRSSLEMNLELYSGTYNFVLLVNSKAALEAMKSGDKIVDPETLVEKNTILTSDDLQGEHRQYLPMVGQRELVVPKGTPSSESNRVKLRPEIKLERVHARLDFVLSTAKDEKGTEYLSPILPLSQVTGLLLENERLNYTVMPSNSDYTVIDGPIRAEALTADKAGKMTRDSFHKGANNAEGKIDRFFLRFLPYDSNKPIENQSSHIYIAPSALAQAESDCLTLVFKVKFANDEDDTVYKIPLTNLGGDLSATKKFVTRRNTIYFISARLKGRDLTDLDYDVIGWGDQDVDIPW